MTDIATATAETAWITDFATHAARSEDEYNDLDQQIGDGDFGTNLALGGRLTQQRLAAAPDRALAAVAQVFLDDIGGSSGPLFGLLFGNVERATRDAFTPATLAAGVRAGRDAIVRVGRAEVGDKTMIDALDPIVDALEQTEATNLAAAFDAAAAAGAAGAESTRQLRARRGRASYVGDRAIGAVDPGAVAVARFFRFAAQSF